MKKLSSIILIVLITSITCLAQGELFSASRADGLFGPVKQKIAISVDDMTALISRTNDVVMFRLDNSNLSVLGDSRKIISSSKSVAPTDKYHVYSKAKVLELIKKGGGKTIYIEKRSEVLSLTNGSYTLEMGSICPPCCPDC